MYYPNYILLIILNVFTLFLINLLFIWCPKFYLFCFFKKTCIENARYVAIYELKESKEKLKIITELKTLLFEGKSYHLLDFFCKIDIVKFPRLKVFQYKNINYLYNDNTNEFIELNFKVNNLQEIMINLSLGLLESEVTDFRNLFGKCELSIEIDSYFNLALKEISDPFYVFQIFAVILWFFEDYITYSLLIIIATVVSLIMSVTATRENLENIKEMANTNCSVRIFRRNSKNEKIEINTSSENLVPGDIFEIPDTNMIMPCDAILVEGSVVMNESILTGESNPIIKSSIKQEETPNLQNNKHLLFFGSKIVQKNTFENEKCLGIVQNTGYKTVKGGLIRSILFPQDTSNKFEKDSTKYIIVMATLSVIGFFISSYYLFSIGIGLREIIFRSFDMITITVPPALPACISIGISKALSNLKKKNIKCIDREKINNAGRINHICFDKTGTLTEENLDISGFLPNIYINKNFEFGEIATSFENHMESIFYHFKNEKKNMAKTIELISLYIECFACCHSITKINQNLMGDMIDLKMFQMSGFFIDDSKENSFSRNILHPMEDLKTVEKRYLLQIIKTFEFNSSLQRMSVIVRSGQDLKIFCKGSPENIYRLCKKETLPENYSNILNFYSIRGYRIIALAVKYIMTDKVSKIKREMAENDLNFLGLVIMHNKLKKETKATILELKNANLDMVMVTGDNILTSLKVAKETTLIEPNQKVYTVKINIINGKEKFVFEEILEEISLINKKEDNSNIERNSVFSSCYLPESIEIDNFKLFKSINEEVRSSLIHNSPKEKELISEIILYPDLFSHTIGNNVLAIQGDIFSKIISQKRLFLNQPKILLEYKIFFDYVLKNCRVFSRMTPDDKAILVESYKELGRTVCMCGDGANDCSALKSADVGLSLSLLDSSIAAPFSSSNFEISSLLDLLIEGKSSLDTSYQCFKFMMLYSIIQFFSVTILLTFGSYLTNNQFLSIDAFIIFPLAYLISRTETIDLLTSDQPIKSLLSIDIITSILFQTIAQFTIQLISLLTLTSKYWYSPFKRLDMDSLEDELSCSENTIIYIISIPQYLIVCLAFTLISPFKKPLQTNIGFCVFLLIGLIYSLSLIIGPDSFSKNMLELKSFDDQSFKFEIILFMILNMAISLMIEYLVVPLVKIKKRRIFKI